MLGEEEEAGDTCSQHLMMMHKFQLTAYSCDYAEIQILKLFITASVSGWDVAGIMETFDLKVDVRIRKDRQT